MLTDAIWKRQHVGPRGIVDNQFARPYDRLAVTLSDQAFARQLKPENDAGPQIVTRQLRGSLGGRMIGPHREDGQLPEIGDRADSRRGAAIGGEGELHMDEGLRDRVTNGVGPVARRESAGIEKHRHGCATHWAPVGSTAILRASQRGHVHRALCPGTSEYNAFGCLYTDRCAIRPRGNNDRHGPAGWSRPALITRSDTDRRDNPVSPGPNPIPPGWS